MEFQIPVISLEDHKLWPFDTIQKIGCFAIKAPKIAVDFLNRVHDHYLHSEVTQDECSGRNKLHLDPGSQIIRLFVLDLNEKYPFSDGFDEINTCIKDMLNQIWQVICQHYGIKISLQSGEDSAGMHHYPKGRQSFQGLKPHIDSTLVVCNLPTGPGLEVYYDGQWHDAYLKDHMIINIGFLAHMVFKELHPCIHKVRQVNYDRSVIAFSPGYSGEFNDYDVVTLIREFYNWFETMEVSNEDELEIFKQKILSNVSYN